MKYPLATLASLAFASFGMQPAYAESSASLHCYPITLQDAYPYNPPAYSDYPASHTTATSPVAPVFDSALAQRYKAAILTAAANGPDFDGHYTIAKLSCGVSCMHLAVINAQTGNIVFPASVQNFKFLHVNDVPIHYRLDSNLLILLGTVDKDAGDEGIHYFIWADKAMTLVEYIPVHKQSCN